MKEWLKLKIKQFKCNHVFEDKGNVLIDIGRNKMFFWECKKCGKKKVTFLY